MSGLKFCDGCGRMEEMKKLAVLAVVVVIYIGNVFLTSGVWAQEAVGEIGYALAYPGILPDSPIYFLKVARDRVMLWLIRDDQQKAFYLLLLSDKRLAAGEKLIGKGDKGSQGIGAITVIQAEDYFSRAVDEALVAKKSGKDTGDLFAKLTVAGAKHTEVISNLVVKVSGRDSDQLVKARRENEISEIRVMEVFLQAVGLGK